jgi:hypothetical protein
MWYVICCSLATQLVFIDVKAGRRGPKRGAELFNVTAVSLFTLYHIMQIFDIISLLYTFWFLSVLETSSMALTKLLYHVMDIIR